MLQALRNKVQERPIRTVAKKRTDDALKALFARTLPETDQVLQRGFAGKVAGPREQCDAVVDLYEVALALPEVHRVAALHWLGADK